MKHLLLPSIIAALAIAPTFADNEPTLIPTPASCNNNVLNTTSGSASLEAIYTPNTITTQWYTGYGENTAVANATTCTYDGTINFPQTNPSRPGYAFAGWKLRANNNLQCSLSSLDASIYPEFDAQHMRWKPIIRQVNGNATMEDAFGTENSADLNAGDIDVTFSYGNFKAVSTCVNTDPQIETVLAQQGLTDEQKMDMLFGTNGTALKPANTFTAGASKGRYCWCKLTSYTPQGGDTCDLSSTKWIAGMITLMGESFSNATNCANKCAALCIYYFGINEVQSLRQVLFNYVQ